MGGCLRSDTPQSLRARAAYIGRPADWEVWAHLLDSVQSGQPAFPQLHQEQSIWEWRTAHPEENTFFNRAQHAATRRRTHTLLAAYDFGQFPMVADLGGGTGASLRRCWPATRACAACSLTGVTQERRDRIEFPSNHHEGGNSMPTLVWLYLTALLYYRTSATCVALAEALQT